ncbi:hypothetical protein BDR03DRAFT_988271 [Suillus americanus]|nr:hypothetical protein BDR03DRAFT_988271 [Suillus americanus]
MHSLYKVTFSTIPQHSSDFLFLPEAGNRCPHQRWSSEFSTSVILDETNTQKPDIVLTNCKVQVKSWAHILTCFELTVSDLGTIRDLAVFKGVVTKGLGRGQAEGHIIDYGCFVEKPGSVLSWHYLLLVQNGKGDEYALKDCWVDEDKKNHEEDVLNRIQGIPNVVTLIEAWDVKYQNKPDSTLCIHECHRASRNAFVPLQRTDNEVHLKKRATVLLAFWDFVIVFVHGVLVLPYMSIRLLTACAEKEKTKETMTIEHSPSNDIELLFYIFVEFVSTYDGPQDCISNLKMERWAEALEDMGHSWSI